MAQVALYHPDQDQVRRERQAATYAIEAMRTDPKFGSQQSIIDFFRQRLVAWARLSPQDPTPAQFRAEFKKIYPNHAKEIDEPVAKATNCEKKIL